MASKRKKSFRITELAAKRQCEYEKYNDKKKYPFINFLPFTIPSIAAQNYDAEKMKASTPSNAFNIQEARKIATIDDTLYPIQDTTNCIVIKERINGVNCDWIKYKGSDIKNGVILQLHGGGYILSSHIKLFAQSELLSKLTGMVCLCINYSLAPEYPLTKCVDELISIYKYILNEKGIQSSNIFMAGGSAGGGLILLVLQKLKKMYISQPCAVWLDSPWTDLAKNGIISLRKSNNLFDFIYDVMAPMAIGNMDIYGKIINNYDAKSDIFSPFYGDFNGLCPMYFTVCATEILLDDTLYAAEKAYKNGVDIRVDVAPFMLHCFAYKVNLFQEAYIQTVIASEWMMKQKRKHMMQNKL